MRTDFLIVGERVENLGEHYRVLCGPADAAALGADAVIMFLALGVEDGALLSDNARAISEAAHEARRLGLALICEVVPWGSRLPDDWGPETLEWGCRMAVELGADIIKTEYTGDAETLVDLVESCPVPLLVLGGAKAEFENELIESTRAVMEAGAKGVIYGRNIWQAEDPERVFATVREIVHGRAREGVTT